jgi:sugar/nucleoside kinase (ribokinase family)
VPRPATGRATRDRPPRVVVLGDLLVDVVVRPATPPVPGTDVPGRIELRAGGSAANTARWIARLGARAKLIAAIGRDRSGRALAAALRDEGVRLHLARPRGRRTGRIGVLVSPDGERTFVADRGAADGLTPGDVRAAWLRGAALLHLPAYSLLAEPLRQAAERAVVVARADGTLVSLDLASAGPLLAGGREAALALVRSLAPDLLFATKGEAAALTGAQAGAQTGAQIAAQTAAPLQSAELPELLPLLELAPLVVLKLGSAGATVLARASGRPPLRLDVPTSPLEVTDSTGAGDAFDAGFIVAWLRAPAKLRAATTAGHRVARRELVRPRPELALL